MKTFPLQCRNFSTSGMILSMDAAAKEPDKTAMVWVNQQGEERRYSFSDMKRESDIAALILHDIGILKGDRVFIMLPRIPEWWILIVALIKRGAVYTPAPTLLTPHEAG